MVEPRLRAALAALLALACLAVLAPAALGVSLPSGFREEKVLTGLAEPTSIRFAPPPDGRIFVAQKSGKILVFDDFDDADPAVFADLGKQVYDHGDRGLLGLALDPDFAAGRPYVYALYTYDHVLGEAGPAPRWGDPENPVGDSCAGLDDPDVDDCPVSGRLVRFTAVGDHAELDGLGEPAQRVLVEDWCQQFSSHSIGDLQFDAGGALYASGGDGANFNDVDFGQSGWPHDNQCGDLSNEGGALRAQDLRTPADPVGLDGSIIRIDPDTGEGLPGNPRFDSASANARRIVAYGFRNPFRFLVDDDNAEIYAGNVGWNTWEEIDRLPLTSTSAFNSGWPCYEGPAPNPSYAGLGLGICQGLYGEAGSTAPPFFAYEHGADAIPGDLCEDGKVTGSAISGMALYPDSGPFPDDYANALFFADPVRGCVFVAFAGEDGRPDPAKVANFIWQGGLYPGVDLEIGPEGDLFYVQVFNSDDEGVVHRVFFDPDTPFARIEASPRFGPLDLEVQFDGSASSDPQGGPLSYEWDLDGDGELDDSTAVAPQFTYPTAVNRTVSLRVEDGEGKANVDTTVVYPGDTPPQVEIVEPDPALTWGVGQEIDFSGLAIDQEEGALPGAQMRWSTRILHCPGICHAHPFQGFPETASGTLRAPDHDYPAHLEFVLTATDSRGLSSSQTVEIDPRAVLLRFQSDPPGVTLGAGPRTDPAPFELTAIEGGRITLSAPPAIESGGRALGFAGWSDGGARVHTISADAAATYTASYAEQLGPQPPPPASPPNSRLLKRPPRRTGATTARFAFRGDRPGLHFLCKLDAAPYRPCRSPRIYRNLRPGRHVLRLAAVDADGTREREPVLFGWRVLAAGPA